MTFQLILDWIDAGSPGNTENDPLKELADVSNDKWQLGQPDIIVDFDQQFIPATGLLKYRYAVADVGNQKDLWVKAVDIKPSKPELMHHALLFDGHNFELETINNLLDVELIIEKWFYENGQVKSEQKFNNGKPESEMIRWRSDGTLVY